MNIDQKIRQFENKSKAELKAIFLLCTQKLLLLLKAVGMEEQEVKVLLTLFCAASRSDGKMSTTEYNLMTEALSLSISYSEMNDVIANIAATLDAEDMAQKLAETFGAIDDDYRECIVDYCLSICAADGNVDRVEKSFLESLIGYSVNIGIGITVKFGTPYITET